MGIVGRFREEAFSKANKEAYAKVKKRESTPVKKPGKLDARKEFIYRCLFDMNYSDEKAAAVLKMDVKLVKALRAQGRI